MTAALITIFVISFLTQIAGATLIGLDVRDDLRTARRLANEDVPTTFTTEAPGITIEWQGMLGQELAAQSQAKDTFREFVNERLTGSLGRRIVGIALVIVGAAIALAGDVLSTLG